jgi:hypothetical protein
MNNIQNKPSQNKPLQKTIKDVIPDKPNQKPKFKPKSKSKPKPKSKILSIYSTFYAFLFVSIILIYYILIPLLNMSGIKDNGIELLKTYYIDNKYKSLIMDFLFATLILKISENFPNHIPIIFRRILIIVVFDVILGLYINNTPYLNGTMKFLKEWSSSAGWFAIVWDVVYISLIGKVADKIDNIRLIKNNKLQLIIFGMVVISLMHV